MQSIIEIHQSHASMKELIAHIHENDVSTFDIKLDSQHAAFTREEINRLLFIFT